MNKPANRGFTLVELLVGLAVGAIVLVAAALAWSVSVGTTNYTLEATRLNHDLRSTMQIITQDLRRADAGSVQFSATGDCVEFTVAPPPDLVAACAITPQANSACWVVRGFRLNGGDIDMYLSQETQRSSSICSTDDNWVPVYDEITGGALRVTNFAAQCEFRCLEISDDESAVLGPDFPPSGYTFDPNDCVPVDADGLPVSRCEAATSFGAWAEILSVRLTLEGEVDVRGRARRLEFQDLITVRNNEVRLP